MTDNFPNWFESTARANFERFLAHKRGLPEFMALQIGAFVGHASEWMLRNLITGKNATLHDVDTWQGSNEAEHGTFDWSKVEEAYYDRVKNWRWTHRLTCFKMTSDKFFEALDAPESFVRDGYGYDFVYVDGSHKSHDVYRDAVNAWKWLRPRGTIAFDDYKWSDGVSKPEELPKAAIDRFMFEHAGQFRLLEYGYQVWLRKS
jgi:hypothetical protein